MLFLDTANIEQIKHAEQTGIIQGVTTNPTILLKENIQRVTIIKEILQATSGIVFVQTIGETTAEIMEDATAILATFQDKRVALKIPAHLDGIQAIKQLKTKHPDVAVLATAIYATEQNLLAALAGADYVAPYINRMQNNRIDAYNVIAETRKIYDDQKLQTKILAASFKNTGQIVETLSKGAHTVTIPYELFVGMANKDLALGAIKQFNTDANTLLREGDQHE